MPSALAGVVDLVRDVRPKTPEYRPSNHARKVSAWPDGQRGRSAAAPVSSRCR